MTDEELIARVRDGKLTWGFLWRAADRIEALMKERDAAKQIALVSITHGQDAEARAERLEAAIRELKRCWYQGDLTENDFAAALKENSHE